MSRSFHPSVETPSALPLPDREALAHSRRLQALLAETIAVSAGSIPFDRFMELALYAPGLGYYSAGAQKFGAAGDFITAPETSPLFGRCLAQQCRQVLASLGGGDILELGAGSGALAVELLCELERQDCLPDRYLILEVSADLRERQQHYLQAQNPMLAARVTWLDSLPDEPIRGVIVGNEVLDALPVRCLLFETGAMSELAVSAEADQCAWHVRAADIQLQAQAEQLLAGLSADFDLPYRTEVNIGLMPWLQSVASVLEQGLLLFIDYGYPRAEYYHPQRNTGTLICHYRHRAHADPFLYPGLQDISASVDFTQVAEAADLAGLQVAGFTTQAQFLFGCGLEQLLAAAVPDNDRQYLKWAGQVKQLTLPAEMGERFKAIAMTRNFEQPLLGFSRHDQRHRL